MTYHQIATHRHNQARAELPESRTGLQDLFNELRPQMKERATGDDPRWFRYLQCGQRLHELAGLDRRRQRVLGGVQ